MLGVGWRITYEPHPKRRFKARPFSSLGSLITDNSETSDLAKSVGIFALSLRIRGKGSVFAQASQKRRGVGLFSQKKRRTWSKFSQQ